MRRVSNCLHVATNSRTDVGITKQKDRKGRVGHRNDKNPSEKAPVCVMVSVREGRSPSLHLKDLTMNGSWSTTKLPALPSTALAAQRGPSSQNGGSITQPEAVLHFPTPQFPICLMGIITAAHFIATLAFQKHSDAMVTGGITPPTLPHADSIIQQNAARPPEASCHAG